MPRLGRSRPFTPYLREQPPYFRYLSPGNYSTSGYQAATNNPQWNHTTVGHSLEVFMGLLATASVSSATFNGVALILKGTPQDNGTDRSETWVWDVAQGVLPRGTYQISVNL